MNLGAKLIKNAEIINRKVGGAARSDCVERNFDEK